MFDLEERLKQFPVIELGSGDVLLTQGEKTDTLYFLIEGGVSVVKDGFELTHKSLAGSVYGEMSVILDIAHSATVKCTMDSRFYYIKNPKKYLEGHPEVIWHIVKILSMRLASLNEYLVDIRSQYEIQDNKKLSAVEKGSDRKKIVNEILQILQV